MIFSRDWLLLGGGRIETLIFLAQREVHGVIDVNFSIVQFLLQPLTLSYLRGRGGGEAFLDLLEMSGGFFSF